MKVIRQLLIAWMLVSFLMLQGFGQDVLKPVPLPPPPPPPNTLAPIPTPPAIKITQQPVTDENSSKHESWWDHQVHLHRVLPTPLPPPNIPPNMLAPNSPPPDIKPTPEDWKNQYFKKHPQADANNDGTLSWPELKAHEKNQYFKKHPLADANKDGTLSWPELNAHKKLKDEPKDGVLTLRGTMTLPKPRGYDSDWNASFERSPSSDTNRSPFAVPIRSPRPTFILSPPPRVFGRASSNMKSPPLWSDFTYNSPEEKAFWDKLPDWSFDLWLYEKKVNALGQSIDLNSTEGYTGYLKNQSIGVPYSRTIYQFVDGFLLRKASWNRQGQKKWEVNYKDGKMDGLETRWYDNGQKKEESNYKYGKYRGGYYSGYHGLVTEWYENGQKRTEYNFKDNERDGLSTAWYENGQKAEEQNHKEGYLDGLFIKWNKDGTESYRMTYKDGVRVD